MHINTVTVLLHPCTPALLPGACFEEMPGHDYSYGAYGSGGRDVVHIVPARHRVAHPVHVPGIQGADEESKVHAPTHPPSSLAPILLCTNSLTHNLRVPPPSLLHPHTGHGRRRPERRR